MKKCIALVLMFAILSVWFPNTHATAVSSPPSIEEILNDYASKVFEAEVSSQNLSSQNSRSVSPANTSLASETINVLNAAGYDAYHLTPSTKETLNATLRTDFDEFGLDMDGSYIVVISGEERNDKSRSIGGGFIEEDDGGIGGGGPGFYYTYNGTTYLMRYVTITSSEESCLRKHTRCTLADIRTWADYVGDVLNSLFYIGIDLKTAPIPTSSIVSLLGNWLNNPKYELLETEDTLLDAATSWTRRYIQVWNEAGSYWHTAQCSTYASARAKVTVGYVYNHAIKDYEWVTTPEVTRQVYSDFYNNYDIRCTRAVNGFLQDVTYFDYAGDIGYSFYDENLASITVDGEALITHAESVSYLLPIHDYSN